MTSLREALLNVRDPHQRHKGEPEVWCLLRFDKNDSTIETFWSEKRVTSCINRPINGSINGSIKGPFKGPINGSLKGTLKGTMKGFINGSIKGSINGSLDGSINGTLDQRPLNRSIVNILKGSIDGSFKGFFHGFFKGSFKGFFYGSIDGPIDGFVDESPRSEFEMKGETHNIEMKPGTDTPIGWRRFCDKCANSKCDSTDPNACEGVWKMVEGRPGRHAEQVLCNNFARIRGEYRNEYHQDPEVVEIFLSHSPCLENSSPECGFPRGCANKLKCLVEKYCDTIPDWFIYYGELYTGQGGVYGDASLEAIARLNNIEGVTVIEVGDWGEEIHRIVGV